MIAEILKKLHYKSGLKSAVLNAPVSIEQEFKDAGLATTLVEKSEFTILFVKDKKDLETNIKGTLDHIEYDSILWIAYPKGSSSLRTDINRDRLWDLLKPYQYRPVAQVAIDNDWSALRFRPADKVKGRE